MRPKQTAAAGYSAPGCHLATIVHRTIGDLRNAPENRLP
jgi:hypothetical protein